MVKKSDRSRIRLLEAETGTIRKKRQERLNIALIYPNTYHVGMSNLGFQTVYQLLNDIAGVNCERAFLPDASPSGSNALSTMESGRSIAAFDIIAFSISFENDFPNLLTILDMVNLPLLSTHRDQRCPLITAGGVACFLNPEPIAPFFDCFFMGEAEALLPRFVDLFQEESNRETFLLKAARDLTGIYVPAFYQDHYNPDGTFKDLAPLIDVPERIQRVCLTDLEKTGTCSTILTPNTTFDQTYLIEVSRGCPHGCRFCAAGFVYRPPRFRPGNLLQDCIREGQTRSHKIGLVGAAVSDLPDLDKLLESNSEPDTEISFSSLRADSLSDTLLTQLRSNRVKTATIAPDAGSERMRACINKGLSEKDILDSAEKLVLNGIPNLKLYFMIGLPFETIPDVDAIVALCKKIKHRFLKSSRSMGRMGDITVSLSAFVPKPHTPFQWAPMDEVPVLKQKIKRVKQGLKGVPNMKVHADVPRWAYLQALFSRGDRRVADLLLLGKEKRGNWAQTFKESVFNPDFYVYRERFEKEVFPWDFIDHGIQKSYLKTEYRKARKGENTMICDPQSCTRCGACTNDQ